MSRHPRGRTYRNISTFNHSRPRNKHPAGVRLLTWGENPPTRTCKRGRGMNRRNLHVWLNRRADGLTRRYCDVYEPAYRQNAAPSGCLTPAGRTSSVSHLQVREDKRRRQRQRAVFATNLWEGRGEVVSAKKKKTKKEENELEISSQAHSVTHLAGPPTSRVPPSYVAPIRQRKACPHPSEEGRASQLRFHIEERERRGRRRRWWETRETDPA